MITDNMNIQITKGVEDAPKYGNDFKAVKIDTVVVVPRGTVNGNPTVDIQLSDADGNKYVVMVTGGIIETLASVVATKRIQTNSN